MVEVVSALKKYEEININKIVTVVMIEMSVMALSSNVDVE